jgi:hypothetical protein
MAKGRNPKRVYRDNTLMSENYVYSPAGQMARANQAYKDYQYAKITQTQLGLILVELGTNLQKVNRQEGFIDDRSNSTP